MLYAPSVFGENLVDDLMNVFGYDFPDLDHEMDRAFGEKNPLFGKHARNMMKTDVREKEDGFEVDIELPGFKKEEIQIDLENGYLGISAQKGLDKEEKNKEGKVIRQERYAGSLARSFYVGEDLKETDIKARLENGVLRLEIPKLEHKEEIPEKKTIMIEG